MRVTASLVWRPEWKIGTPLLSPIRVYLCSSVVSEVLRDYESRITAFMIDLRSDTVTEPTQAMLEAMSRATFGDDARDGDATVQALEALAADMTGKDAGLFLPSGTMANLLAVLAHSQRGGQLVAEATSHVLNSEGGLAEQGT